ncbi:hypothetical protein CSO01_05260 [Cellulomonas soli]|uniref:Uncharacterized protein n=2 Tax=Cellulomonas soli TaxID=931535 RepID=A0A512P9D2_9CELL|nr:hypothetical protein CSO01_05260 [Cellulomonas soli]
MHLTDTVAKILARSWVGSYDVRATVDTIYQASDLATKRREFIDAARVGRAHLRDTDGTELVALRAGELEVLEGLAYWSGQHRRIERLLRDVAEPNVEQLGDLAWLRAFDRDDLLAFVDELYDCLIAASADRDLGVLGSAIAAWRATAQQLEDPLRRSVLLARHDPADFVEADRP